MIKGPRRELKRITKPEAREIMELQQIDCDRNLNAGHVSKLQRRMNEGAFRGCDVGIVKLNGATYRANSQHTMTAFLGSNLKTLPVTMEFFSCDNKHELSEIYRMYDPIWASRSTTQCMNVEAGSIGVRWSPKLIRSFSSGVTMHVFGIRRAPDIEDRAKAFYEHRAAGDFIASLLCPEGKEIAEYGFMLRGPVVAAMIETWYINKGFAEIFWTKVRDGAYLPKHDPALKLRDFLRGASLRSRIQNGDSCSEHEMLAKCIVAWNAARKDTTTALRYYASKPIPKAI